MIRSPVVSASLFALLLSCSREVPQDQKNPSADSTAIADSTGQSDSLVATSMPAMEAVLDTLPDSVFKKFDRVPTRVIDSSLASYEGGDTLKIDSIGQNECLGERLNRYKLRNGLSLEGNTYHIYATDWIFQGAFVSVLGLSPGMTRIEAERLLGRPSSRTRDSLVYLSERPDAHEAEYFDARWRIVLRFQAGKLLSIVFSPSFDDC
jgi:hypothetical protein